MTTAGREGVNDRPRVLVVDDDVSIRTLLQRMLEHLGYAAAVASDGADAVHAATSGEYVVILMDSRMPGLDGYEATRRIRASENGSDVSIIAMSGATSPADHRRATEAGMDGILAKPMTLEALRAVLQTALDNSHANGI